MAHEKELIIHTSADGWQKQVWKVMKEQWPFKLVTVDSEQKPNSDSPRDIVKWLWGTALPGWVVCLLTEKGIGIRASAFSIWATFTPPNDITLDDGEKLSIAACGTMMLLGGGMILFVFFDPEPTTKLALLVGGGIATTLGGGAVVLTVILTRKKYEWEMSIDKKTGKVTWKAKPKTQPLR